MSAVINNLLMTNTDHTFDHLAEAAQEQVRIYSHMSPADKIRESLRLREFAWSLKKAFLASQNPDWTENQIQTELRRIFLYATT